MMPFSLFDTHREGKKIDPELSLKTLKANMSLGES